MVKERPIIFSTPMVKAILEGRKTQTRRVVKAIFKNWIETANNPEWFAKIPEQCPYGQPGDVLWVRETWAIEKRKEKRLVFKARLNDFPIENDKWKPSIHMPKYAARIWLQITSVRVERLNEISEADAINEGIDATNGFPLIAGSNFIDYTDDTNCWSSPVNSFMSLWLSINGPESWEKNPWVWVVEFTVVSTTGKPKQAQ